MLDVKTELRAAYLSINAAQMRKIVDLKAHKGRDVSYDYWSLALFPGAGTIAGNAIGVPAIAAVAKFGIPTSAVAKHLGEVVYEGTLSLALEVERWRFDLPKEMIDEVREWLGSGTVHERRSRIQDLLGFTERKLNRYLLLDQRQVCSTTDNVSVRREPVMLMIDAHALADEVRKHCNTLFSLTLAGNR